MNIHAFEANRTVLCNRKSYFLQRRLAFSLGRFKELIENIEVRFELCRATRTRVYRCSICIEFKDGISSAISVVRHGKSRDEVFNLAIDSIQTRLSTHFRWRRWLRGVKTLFN